MAGGVATIPGAASAAVSPSVAHPVNDKPIPDENKVIRTITCFADKPSNRTIRKLATLAERLQGAGYTVQTTRVCSKQKDIRVLTDELGDSGAALSVGQLTFPSALRQLPQFIEAPSTAFHVDLTNERIGLRHVDLFRQIVDASASHTFNFCYTFNNAPGSPFFPAASYLADGFAIGLQPTDLSASAATLDEWLAAMRTCWDEIDHLFARERGYLGIDGSIAPFGAGKGSLVNFIKRLGYSFERSTTTDTYVRITNFLRTQNPRPVGLNGLMLPCLEDSELTAEYDAGRFSLERNLFLSLHSGLGIDTCPVGIDEIPDRLLEVLRLTQALSNKHNKALSVRFASDGHARVGDCTDFQSPYLTDCTIRAL